MMLQQQPADHATGKPGLTPTLKRHHPIILYAPQKKKKNIKSHAGAFLSVIDLVGIKFLSVIILLGC